jgi:hypothetical protein
MNDQLWVEVEHRIAEITRRVLREEIETKSATVPIIQTDWMTERDLADYCKVTIHAIRKWTARPPEEHPLPCAYMGDLRRYHRNEVDKWAQEETEHQRRKRSQK